MLMTILKTINSNNFDYGQTSFRPPNIFWGSGWGKEILGCLTGKSLFVSHNQTDHRRTNFLPASQITWIYC